MARDVMYICSHCDFIAMNGGYTYVLDKTGKEIKCPHPSEFKTIASVLGDNPSDELLKKRSGYCSSCLCKECLNYFYLDLNKFPNQCPKCHSSNICTIKNLGREQCPKCKRGILKAIESPIIS